MLVLLSNGVLMNINLQITIPFLDGTSELKFGVNTMLTPFYITERELLTIFLEDYSERFIESAREIIFYSSIRADELIKLNLKLVTQDELLTIKRQLTLCLATILFGNKHNSDFIKSMSRSKTLADFTVSTTVSNDSGFISNILKDAQACIDDLLSIIEEMNTAGSFVNIFVKGELSLHGFDSARLWHHRNLPELSVETHGSLKKEFNGRYYKNGGNYATKPRTKN